MPPYIREIEYGITTTIETAGFQHNPYNQFEENNFVIPQTITYEQYEALPNLIDRPIELNYIVGGTGWDKLLKNVSKIEEHQDVIVVEV